MTLPQLAPEVIEQYNSLHQTVLSTALDALSNATWKESKRETDIVFYTASLEGSSCNMVKSVVTVKKPLQVCIDRLAVCNDIETTAPKEVKDGTNERKTLSRVEDDHDTSLLYIGLETTSRFVSPRDFLLWRRRYTIDSKQLYLHCSVVNDELCPEHKPYVRGKMTFQIYMVEPSPENPENTVLTFMVHADPMGSVPSAVYNAVATNQGMAAKKIKDEIEAQ